MRPSPHLAALNQRSQVAMRPSPHLAALNHSVVKSPWDLQGSTFPTQQLDLKLGSVLPITLSLYLQPIIDWWKCNWTLLDILISLERSRTKTTVQDRGIGIMAARKLPHKDGNNGGHINFLQSEESNFHPCIKNGWQEVALTSWLLDPHPPHVTNHIVSCCMWRTAQTSNNNNKNKDDRVWYHTQVLMISTQQAQLTMVKLDSSVNPALKASSRHCLSQTTDLHAVSSNNAI